MDSKPDPRLLALYQRAVLVRTLRCYTLESIGQAPARDLLQAAELLAIARKVRSS